MLKEPRHLCGSFSIVLSCALRPRDDERLYATPFMGMASFHLTLTDLQIAKQVKKPADASVHRRFVSAIFDKACEINKARES